MWFALVSWADDTYYEDNNGRGSENKTQEKTLLQMVVTKYLLLYRGICDLVRRYVMNIAINCEPIIVCKSAVKNISTGWTFELCDLCIWRTQNQRRDIDSKFFQEIL
jgi:hypothetical protein